MDYSTIAQWVVIGLILTAILITTVINAIKSIKARIAAGESINFEMLFEEISEAALTFISDAENAYEQLKGISNIKTGTLKKDNVLSKIRGLCEDKGIKYNEDYWSKFVDSAVKLINTNTSNTVQTSGDNSVTINLQ